jgi:hypothetical protein
MDLKIAQELVSHNDELRIYEDYSGRGMYGKTTHGVVGSHESLKHAVGKYLVKSYQSGAVNKFIDDLRSDSLGMDIIWY